MTNGPIGTPLLKQLTPYHPIEPSHQKYVSVARFHGTQKLNLMRPTRMPANSRRYTPGDPVHLIDWRAYARNEQLVLREQNDEASCKVSIFVDLADSMDWPGAEERTTHGLCTKQELSWRIALNLAYQFNHWGDQVKLYVVRGDRALAVRMRSQVDAAIVYERLQLKSFAIEDSDLSQVRPVAGFREERADLVYWLSDGFRGLPDWINPRSLVFWLQVLSSLEVDSSWLDPEACYFETDRGGDEFMGASLLAGDNLHGAVHRWMQRLNEEWLKRFTHHMVLTDATPIHQYIFALEQPWLRGSRGKV